MKDAREAVALVADFGYNIPLAEHLAETFEKVYYTSPVDREFRDVTESVYGDGIPSIERIDSMFDREHFEEIDLFIFPDIGFEHEQKHLRALGKAVWGSFDATELEMVRTKFLDWLKKLGLPMANTVKVKGVSKLARHLETVTDKWIKINRWRKQMETWRHRDFEHSRRELDRLAMEFGGVKEHVTFVVQDTIQTDIEIGYDGWSVDGQFPENSFAGYEGKDEIYLGSLRQYGQLPDDIRTVNEAMAGDLDAWGYRNFIATELRKAGEAYFIDPTMRMPGQTGEQLLRTCANLPEIIWLGANGILGKPEWNFKFSASATIHYDDAGPEEWKVIAVPKKVKPWMKLSHYCEADGLYHFPPCHTNELGVILGEGDSIEATFASLREHIDAMSDEPVSFDLDGFFDLLDSIREAEKKGMIFSDAPIPTKEEILKYTA